MANNKFIALLKIPPNEVHYHHLTPAEPSRSKEKDDMSLIRDALVEKIAHLISERDALHQASQLEALLASIGLHLSIEDALKDEQEQQRIIVSSTSAHQASTSLSFLLDWENAHTASFRILTSLVEHQMQQYLIALEKISNTIDKINPEILNFIEQYPTEINLLAFSKDLCTMASCLATHPELQETTQQLFHSQQTGSVAPAGQLQTLKDYCRQQISDRLGYQSEKANMWVDFFSNINSSSLLNIDQQLADLANAQDSAQSALADPLATSSNLSDVIRPGLR